MTATPTTPRNVFGTMYLHAEVLIQALGRKRSLIVHDDGRMLLNLTDYRPGISVEVQFDNIEQIRRLSDRLHDLMTAYDLWEDKA